MDSILYIVSCKAQPIIPKLGFLPISTQLEPINTIVLKLEIQTQLDMIWSGPKATQSHLY